MINSRTYFVLPLLMIALIQIGKMDILFIWVAWLEDSGLDDACY